MAICDINDTIVLSELMRPAPDQAVKAWLLGAEDDLLVTTAISISEIEYGLGRPPCRATGMRERKPGPAGRRPRHDDCRDRQACRRGPGHQEHERLRRNRRHPDQSLGDRRLIDGRQERRNFG